MANSTRRRPNHQAAKPYPDYPLTAHPTGRWCKKVRGKIHFFGKIIPDDGGTSAQAALDNWLAVKDALLAGRTPKPQSDGLTIRELADRFMIYKQHLVDTGELKQSTWNEYYTTCERLFKVFGKERLVADLAPADFETLRAHVAKQWGPTRLGNEIQRVRSVFKYANDADLIERPVKFGPAFKRPSLKVMRKLRAANGPRMFEAKEIRAMLDDATGQLRAMILLGVNVAFGNEDIATLKISALDLDRGWVSHPRPKTGVERRAKLWPETIAAVRDVLATRKSPQDEQNAELVFVTKYGKPWSNAEYGTAVTHEFDKLLRKLKIKRHRLSFYTLRHTHRTIADGSRDSKSCDYIMGHVDTRMAGHYIERIDDERLEAVANVVRHWLFGQDAQGDDGNQEIQAGRPNHDAKKPDTKERPKLRVVSFEDDEPLSA